MKLRFTVNQAECLKRGIDAPKSIVTIEVNPAELPKEVRTIIAARMDGIDVCKLDEHGKIKQFQHRNEFNHLVWSSALVRANEPTLEGLMEAIREDEKKNSLPA